MRRSPKHPALLLLTLLAGLAAACSGGDGARFSDTIVVKEDQNTPVIVSSELVVGPNRFVLGILSAAGEPIIDAKVRLKFYDLNVTQTLKSETEAVLRVPARDAGLAEEVKHAHPDGTTHIHTNAPDDIGVFTANVSFDRPGVWGVEADVDAQKPKVKQTVRVRFDVLERSSTPAIGSPAPRSRNLTAADVADISQIDSSEKPSPELHTSTIADAIAAGKPTLVLFAVPGYCESRFCGPELEIMRKLYPKYRGRAEFIHVEFYKDPTSPRREPVDTVKEWNLTTEPWFFVIDSRGIITAKFEGPTSMQELDEALQKVVP